MSTLTDFQTFTDLIPTDPEHAAKIEDLRQIVVRSQMQPWADTLATIGDFHRAERASATEARPIAAADMAADVFQSIRTRYQHRENTGSDFMGIATGFDHLDRILGGLEAGRITTLLAAPGTGKTTLSNQIAYTCAANGSPVIYVSFENAAADLVTKQVARIAGRSVSEIARGRVAPTDLKQAFETFCDTVGSRLYYLSGSSGTSMDSIVEAVYQAKAQHPDRMPLVVVDYLQQLARLGDRYLGDDMRHRVGSVSRQLVDLAKEADAHVWAISSIGRGNGKRGYADVELASGKESGDLEFDADHVLALQHADNDVMSSMVTESLQLKVLKNRHGAGGVITLDRDRHSLAITERTK